MEGHRGLQAEGPLVSDQGKGHEWVQDRNAADVEVEEVGLRVLLGIWAQDVAHLCGNSAKKNYYNKFRKSLKKDCKLILNL